MNNNNNSIISKISALLGKSNDILIVLPIQPTVDAAAAALSFSLSLSKSQKQSTVACSEPITVGLNRLVGVNKITDKIGSRNLIASFDYIEDSIEKVSYSISEGKFNLVIKPKEGFPPMDTEKVSYSYSGASADLLISIGAPRPENLGKIFHNERKLFDEQETINIDTSPLNSQFGKSNLVDPRSSSLSEIVGLMIKYLNMPIDADIATNLLAGMETATNNFTVKTRAETFEMIAWCMKNGGRREQLKTQLPAQPFNAKPFMTPSIPPVQKMQPQKPPINSRPQVFPQSQPRPQFQPQPQTQPSAVNTTNRNLSGTTFAGKSFQSPVPSAPSPDWLKPKIYKGSSNIQ